MDRNDLTSRAVMAFALTNAVLASAGYNFNLFLRWRKSLSRGLIAALTLASNSLANRLS
jgi:hypothetical protein